MQCHMKETLLDRGKTDKYGYFLLAGSHKEVTTIDPVLKILHKCDYAKGRWCWNKKRILIPKNYVVGGSKVTRYYDAGFIELSKKMEYDMDDQCHYLDDIKDIL
ncbi:Transthyretin-like family protein [Ancylostoma caninum]|uniref:Transthyretin-like family protein n=1 Tax=Ancylostoma caninum TaxID=29170 RepID=A0A368GLD3_ANCCA|nr:Transthyretin-like family protein [Ancylostoma caninum]